MLLLVLGFIMLVKCLHVVLFVTVTIGFCRLGLSVSVLTRYPLQCHSARFVEPTEVSFVTPFWKSPVAEWVCTI